MQQSETANFIPCKIIVHGVICNTVLNITRCIKKFEIEKGSRDRNKK